MDEHFDQLSRTMAGSLPRRKALKLITGTVVGMGAAMLGLGSSSAQAATGCTCKQIRPGLVNCVDATGKKLCGGGGALCTQACEGRKPGDACSC
jgi:hypothetical protein